MWMMMQKDEPDDYVVATGVTNTAASPAWHPYSCRHHHHPPPRHPPRPQVRYFIELAFAAAPVGITIEWQGERVGERKTSLPGALPLTLLGTFLCRRGRRRDRRRRGGDA